MVSFEKSHTLLHELGSLIMETKEIERGAEALGKGIAEETMYLGLDVTEISIEIPMCHEVVESRVDHEVVEGRVDIQPDITAKRREVKIILV